MRKVNGQKSSENDKSQQYQLERKFTALSVVLLFQLRPQFFFVNGGNLNLMAETQTSGHNQNNYDFQTIDDEKVQFFKNSSLGNLHAT